ncbi:MAG: hypothetical protein J6T48_02085 [Bacteroidales bacterium]|nr:hypothetical protein [Bacteroidales bacterium]
MIINILLSPAHLGKSSRFTATWRKKYRHTYDKEDLKRDVQNAVFSIYKIERSLLRREPTLARWTNYHMTNTDKWYFAYTIDGDTITIEDACHAQNMHEKESSNI